MENNVQQRLLEICENKNTLLYFSSYIGGTFDEILESHTIDILIRTVKECPTWHFIYKTRSNRYDLNVSIKSITEEQRVKTAGEYNTI